MWAHYIPLESSLTIPAPILESLDLNIIFLLNYFKKKKKKTKKELTNCNKAHDKVSQS